MLGRTYCLSRLAFVTVLVSASTIMSSLSLTLRKTEGLRWAIKMYPVNFRAVNSGLTRRRWDAEISQGWGQCVFTEFLWKIAETQGSVIWIRVWHHTRLEDLRPISSSALHLSFEPMCVNNIESVMDFSSGCCRPTLNFPLIQSETSMTLLDSWVYLQFPLFSTPPGKGGWEGYKVYSFEAIHSIQNPCKCKINRQKNDLTLE